MSITMPDRAARLLDLAPTPIGPPPAEPPGEPRDHQGEGGSYRSYAKADSAARWVAQETGVRHRRERGHRPKLDVPGGSWLLAPAPELLLVDG